MNIKETCRTIQFNQSLDDWVCLMIGAHGTVGCLNEKTKILKALYCWILMFDRHRWMSSIIVEKNWLELHILSECELKTIVPTYAY